MREIKFRTWDKKDQLMREKIDGRYWTGLEIETGKLVHIEEGKIIDAPKDRLILMQYTGLKDKNGKEIYEGDILEHKSKYPHVAGKFQVMYDTEMKGRAKGDFAAFCLHRIGKWESRYEGDRGWEGVVGSQGHLAKKLKVIGNIYENPEFLKEVNK